MNKSILKLTKNLNLRFNARSLPAYRNKMNQERKGLEVSQNTLNRENQGSLSYKNFKKGLSLLKINQGQAKDTLLRVLECENDIKYEEERVMAQSSLEVAKIFIDERNIKKAQKYLNNSLEWASKGASDMDFLIGDIYYHMGLCTIAKNKQSSTQNHFENYLEIAQEAREDEKNFAKKELSRILLRKGETKDVELMLNNALNFFKEQKNSVYEAECLQLLGEYYLIEQDYEKMLESNLESVAVVESIEGFEKLYLNISKSFLSAGQKLMNEDEEKALVFLRHSLDSFNKLDSEEMGENSWIQAQILVSALEILSKRRDYAECKNIIGRLESENLSRQDFQSEKSYRDFLLCLAQSQMRLELFEDAYKLIKSNSKYWNNVLSVDYHYVCMKLAFENNNFKDALERQRLLVESNADVGQQFESYSISIKSLVKMQSKDNDELLKDSINKWMSFMEKVESKKVSEEITNLFSFFIENSEFKFCQVFLLQISESQLNLDSKVMKLIYTYLSLLSSKKSDLVRAQVYLQMTQESTFSLNFLNSFKKSSSSSDQLLSKMMKSSTIIKECQQGLANMEYVNQLWNLCYKYMEESEVFTAHLLLKEIRRLIASQGGNERSLAIENKLTLLEIVLEIEMGKLEDAATLLKDAVNEMEESKYGDFTPLVYYLYGDTLKDLNSSGEAMVMWIKAVNTYMKMKAKKSCKIAANNALLFENLMSDRSDLLPQLYKETVERNFKC